MRTPPPTCSRGRQPAHAVAGIPDYGKKIEVSKFPYGQPLSKTAYERRDLAFCSCPRYAKGHSLLFNLPISIFLPDASIVADMDILIGYRSALEYWRLVGPGFLRGYQERRTATRYLLDGSASAMETLLALLLYLPNNLGGYGLKKPKLNYRVDAPASLRELADRSYCLCDLCWPEANLAVEYDSRLHHSEPGRQSSDARRRSTLIALGFTVITVFPGHITDSGTFNRLARQVAALPRPRVHPQAP